MTGEHLWPGWMHPYLPKIENPKKRSVFASGTINTHYVTRSKPQPGHPYTRTFKVVCKKCNESWMSEIEERAKPILLPIILGQNVNIDEARRRRLVDWITLKVLVADHDRKGPHVAHKNVLDAFRQSRRIPEDLRIWIAHHNAFEWAAGYWARAVTVSAEPVLPITGLRKNIQTTAFGIGHLFSLTYLSAFPLIGIDVANEYVARLWPSDGESIKWPCPLLPLVGINQLANVIDGLESASFMEWKSPT